MEASKQTANIMLRFLSGRNGPGGGRGGFRYGIARIEGNEYVLLFRVKFQAYEQGNKHIQQSKTTDVQ